MSTPKALIAGAGLGGLQCAYILARNGYKVTVLEQCAQVGGCLQTFHRKGMDFDTGFHYTGGLGKGESLEWLFEYFKLMDLPWVRMDEDCVDEVVIGDRSFHLASGFNKFESQLCTDFPDEIEGIKHFRETIESICKGTRSRVLNGEMPAEFGVGAYDFICSCTNDNLLRQVLAGASLRLHTDAGSLSLYEYAQIYGSFIQSGWRLRGGGKLISDCLVDSILRMGGDVLTNTRLTVLRTQGNKCIEAHTEDGQSFEADIFVSDIHPAITLDLFEDPSSVRRIYRERIGRTQDSYGIFTVNIALKPGKLPYLGHNIHIHSEGADIWHQQPGAMESFLVSFYAPQHGEFAEGVDILTSVAPDTFANSYGAPMHRAKAYEDAKKRLAMCCIDAVSKRLPELKNAIKDIYTSTPNTYEYYTSTRGGSAFGIKKDFNNPLLTLVSPRTPISNLFLTGQNLNIHGMLGVSLTSLLTCREILGAECISNDINRSSI